MQLFLWKLSQDVNDDYDTYDSAVVVAPDPLSASMIHPARYSDNGEPVYYFDKIDDCWRETLGDATSERHGWCRPNDVTVICIGKASDHLSADDVVCSSYNAG